MGQVSRPQLPHRRRLNREKITTWIMTSDYRPLIGREELQCDCQWRVPTNWMKTPMVQIQGRWAVFLWVWDYSCYHISWARQKQGAKTDFGKSLELKGTYGSRGRLNWVSSLRKSRYRWDFACKLMVTKTMWVEFWEVKVEAHWLAGPLFGDFLRSFVLYSR